MLKIPRTPFKYGRFADAIQARSGMSTCRTNAFAAASVFQPKAHVRHLLQVHCPNCQAPRTSKGLKLNMVTNHAELKCQICNETGITKHWACVCGEKWWKCPIHVFSNFVPESHPKKRQRIHDANGVDKPPPKSRRLEFDPVLALGGAISRGPIARPPNEKLAARFPHLVKTVATDLRVATG